jgi:autotransporter passenger strand-loop-strand repeat protein
MPNVTGSTTVATSDSSQYFVQSGGTLTVVAGGHVNDTVVSSGGKFILSSGGIETSATVSAGGQKRFLQAGLPPRTKFMVPRQSAAAPQCLVTLYRAAVF